MKRGPRQAGMATLVGLALASPFGCGTPVTAPAARSVCYTGRVVGTSPDGRIPYFQADAVFLREVLDGGQVIVETRTVAPPSPSMPPTTSRLRLRKRTASWVFDASDGDLVWSGQATFQDERLQAWTFALRHPDSGMHTGQGTVSQGGFRTERITEGARPMRIVEEFRPVPRDEYDRALGLLKPLKGAE